ncbi:MAG TPA: hypothetical protein VFP24_05595 [Gaiellaceae bacterium]|nr:hypothetical protein [Gaiellaceae bacterium]
MQVHPLAGRRHTCEPFNVELYDNELYDISHEQWRFRQFGIPWKEVQRDTYVIVEPPASDGQERHGVYPLGGRDRLNLYGGKPLPFGEWGIEFAQHLPPAIQQRLQEVRPSEEIDRSWKDRFAERYLQRWRQLRFRLHPGGEHRTTPAHRAPLVTQDRGKEPGETLRPKRPRNVQSQLQQDRTTADRPARGRPARQVEMASAIPDWIPAKAEDMDEPYYVAAFDRLRPRRGGVLERARPVARREGRACTVTLGARPP